MKREIKFRGKRIDNGEWVEGYFTKNPQSGNCYITTYSSVGGAHPWPVDPETVGEFTNLLDKNGKEIWEGDIVEGYFAGIKGRYEIVYGSDACYYGQSAPHNGIKGAGTQTVGLNNIADWAEVIGNIHDNPELMEGEK